MIGKSSTFSYLLKPQISAVRRTGHRRVAGQHVSVALKSVATQTQTYPWYPFERQADFELGVSQQTGKLPSEV